MLRVGDHLTVNFQLQVGELSEAVEVQGEISGINTNDFRVDGGVSRVQIESLPLNGRNFLELARLEPGVTVVSSANPGGFGNAYQRVSMPGSVFSQTRISADGAMANDRLNGGMMLNFSQETVQEFQISSFSFDLATGTTGAGAVNIVSRHGGNSLHGSVFFNYRDYMMAAYPGLTRDLDNPEPFFARRQSGFNLGGPVKRDRFFWFTTFERNNQDGVFAIANNHPIFSKLDLIHPGPLEFNLFNVRIDAKINDKHNSFLRISLDRNNNFAPAGTGTFMPSNWMVGRNAAAQIQGGLISVLTPRLISDLRFSYSRLNGRLDPTTARECTNPVACLGLGGPEIQIFDAPIFRIGNQNNVPLLRYPRTYQLTNNLTLQSAAHRLRFSAEWEHFDVNVSYAFNEPAQVTLWGPTDLLQAPSLRPLYDALPASLKDATTGRPTLDEILQLPLRSFTMGIGDPKLPGRFNSEEASHDDRLRFSFQDAWNLRSNLTLTYGLAYSYHTDLFNYDLDRPAYLAPILGGDLRPPDRDANNFDSLAGLAWSVGKDAKTVFRGGGGIYHDEGIFFSRLRERAFLGPSGDGRVNIDGAVAGLSFLSTPTGFRGQDLLPLLSGIRSGIASRFGDGTDLSVRNVEIIKQGDRIFHPDHTSAYAIHLGAGVQRELMPNLVLTADYVMRRYVHLGGPQVVSLLDRNRFNRPKVTGLNPDTGAVSFVRDPVIPLCTPAQANALDPRDQCSAGPINVFSSDANYRYQGLHVKVDKRFSSRLQMAAGYALAKQTGFVEFTQYDNIASGYGNVADQRRHRFTVSGVYDLPEYQGSSPVLRGLLNSWTIAFISQTDSSPPLNTILAGLDLDGDGISRTLLPGTTHNGLGQGLSTHRLRELVAQYNADVESRTRRAANAEGVVTLIRPRTPFNQIINPITLPEQFSNGDSFITQDLRVTRRIGIGEAARLSLIGEVFDLFNVANLTGYNNVLNQVNYGQPSARAGQVFGTGGPRAFQFGARLDF